MKVLFISFFLFFSSIVYAGSPMLYNPFEHNPVLTGGVVNSVPYYSASNIFSPIPIGASGTFLQSNGALLAPSFVTINQLPTNIPLSILETHSSGSAVWKTPKISTGDSLLNCSYIPYAVYNVYTGCFNQQCLPDSSTDNSNSFRIIMDSAQARFWKYHVNPVFVFPYVQGQKNYYGFSTLYTLYGSTNVQSLLWMPKDSNNSTAYTQQEVITLKGGDMESVSEQSASNTQNIGVRIGTLGKAQPTRTNGQPAVIAIPKGLSNTGGFNQLKLDISGLTIVARNNTNEAGVYAPYAECLTLNHVNILTDTAPNLAPVTTAPGYNVGVYYPGEGNSAKCFLNDVFIAGFNTGIVASDHFSSNQKSFVVFGNVGLRLLQSTHPICITDICFQQVKYWVSTSKFNVINPFGSTLVPMNLNIDGENDVTVPTVDCVVDSNTIGLGIVHESMYPLNSAISNTVDSNISIIDEQGRGQIANRFVYAHDVQSAADLFVYRNNNKGVTTQSGFAVQNSGGNNNSGYFLISSTAFTTNALFKANQVAIASSTGCTNGLIIGTNANANLVLYTNGNSATHGCFVANGTQNIGIGGNPSFNTASWVNYSAGTTTVCPITLTSGTNLTTATTGGVEYDGKNLWFTPVGTQRYTVPFTIFTSTQNNSDSNSNVATTIIGTTGVGSTTLPSNFLVSGRTIHVKVVGYHSAAANPTLTITMSLGGTTILTTGAVNTANGTQNSAVCDFWFTCRTTGSSGTVVAGGQYEETGAGSNAFSVTSLSPIVINTTTTEVIDVKATWSAASTSNVWVGQMCIISSEN